MSKPYLYPFHLCDFASGNLNKMCVKISVYTCLCGEKRKFSKSFEDIWLVLNVDGLCVVIRSLIIAAEVFYCVISGVALTNSCQVCRFEFYKIL